MKRLYIIIMKRLYIFIHRRFHPFICYIIFGVVLQVTENPFVENDGHEYSDCDAGVGEVEDGGEEVGTAPKREFIGDREEFEVEHVDYLAEEERRVAVPEPIITL